MTQTHIMTVYSGIKGITKMYRDSKLGLCLDLTGPDGNVYAIMSHGNHLAKQLGNLEDWEQGCAAARIMDGNYMTMVNLFREYFPMVTLIGYDRVAEVHRDVEQIMEGD